MILNYDLIRNILIELEKRTDGYRNYPWQALYESNATFQTSYSEVAFRYHVKYLYDAGYVQSDVALENIIDLTPVGRDYLNNIRNDDIWHATKEKFSKIGNVTLPIVSEIAKTAILKVLGLGS